MNERRNKIVVDRGLQTRIVAEVCWPAALALAALAVLLVLLCAQFTQLGLDAEIELKGVSGVVVTGVTFLSVTAIYFIYHCLKVSHRVAGPAQRLVTTLRQVRAGDPGARVRLRRRDYLPELAAELNAFLDWAEPRLIPEDAEDAEDDLAAVPQQVRATYSGRS